MLTRRHAASFRPSVAVEFVAKTLAFASPADFAAWGKEFGVVLSVGHKDLLCKESLESMALTARPTK